jgi:hypothetical protein
MVHLHGPSDPSLDAFTALLQSYADAHPRSRIELYRDPTYSAVRVQIVDPRFSKLSWVERHEEVWPLFNAMDERVLAEMYSLVLLSPKEVGKTGHSLKFLDLMPKPEARPAPAAARSKKRVR